eukprot:6206211-Pleurochrysis_carterae.AAC.2
MRDEDNGVCDGEVERRAPRVEELELARVARRLVRHHAAVLCAAHVCAPLVKAVGQRLGYAGIAMRHIDAGRWVSVQWLCSTS